MERINKVFRNGEPLSAEELNGIVRYINELGETIEENLDDWSSLNAVEEMWNSLREDNDSNRIHNSHSPLSYPLSSINGANLGLPPYSDMTIASDGNGGWLWKKVNQGGGGGGSSSLQGINKLRTYFLNVAHGTVPSAPSVNNYNSSPQDNFTNGQDVWTFTNTNPTNDLDTYAIWVWFLSNTPVNIDGPIKIFDGAVNSSNGEDGEEIEWIYRRVSIIPSETTLNSWENTLANCIGSASAQDGKTFENADAIPFDWYDNPQGVTNAEKYEYASFRRSVNGNDGKRIWGTTGFCRPFIWSTYGEKGMDGDGVEYIFWGKAEAITNWNTFGQNQENASNYPPGWTNNEGFLDNEYMGPSGSLWSDDPLGINSTTRRYIYMSKRKKVQNPLTGVSSWESFSVPVLWSLFADLPSNGINGSYILEVYRNDTATLLANLSNIPSSDNRDYPPTGWTTSPQERSSNQFTWCMQRTMGYDEYNQASPGAWGTPFRLTGDNGNDGEDGKYTEFIYKHFTSELTFGNDANNPSTWSTTDNNLNSPDNPLREDYTGPSGNKWSDNPLGVDDTYIYEYMCQRTFDGNNYGAFTNPVMWSKYGLNGRDGDGFEYIFKGFSSEQTSWNTNSDDYPPKWITSESSAFLGDDYLGPTGHTWADDAIGVDDTNNKFVYVCSRKKYVDLGASRATWHTFSTPKLWAQYVPPGTQGPEGRRGTYTLFIFKTTSSDLSNSANYSELSTSNSSIPSGWSETATSPSSSSEYIWGSHRLISFNTSNEEIYGSWQTPYKVSGKDGISLSSYILMLETWCDAVSVGGIYTEPTPNSGWSDGTPTNSNNYKYLWRRSRKMVINSAGTDYEAEKLNGVLTDEGKWKYMKLSGTNGTSVNTKGTVATASDLNNISNPSDGDAYKCEADGCLYVWSSEANRWINLGQFKGELGIPGTTYYTHIAWAGDVTLGSTPSGHTTTGQTTSPNASSVTDFSVSPFNGATWMGTLVNTVNSDSTDSLAYTWVYVKGQQGPAGNGCEYIYKGFTSQLTFGQNNDNPAYWAANQTDGYTGPNGSQWSSTMIATSSLNKFVYTSVRKKVNGSWLLFETPVLSSNFATAESATTTVVYQLVATVSEIRYKRNHAGVVVWMPDQITLKLFKFEGTTFTQLNSLPSGYSVLRIIDGTNTASTSLGTVNTSNLASYTSNGDPVMGSRVSIEVLDENNAAIAILNLSIVREFLRMLIPVGAYVSKRYDMTDTTVPLVLGSNGKYYYLDADTNEVSTNTYVDPTTANQTVWGEASEYEVILTKALFADFAKLGSFVVYDKYFFSLFGYLYDSDGSYSIINTSSAAPAAYANFDPNDPMVNTLPSSGNLKFRPAKIINAETGEEWGANGNIHIGTDGSVDIKGNILATSLIAGNTSGLNITTTGTAINFNEGNDTRAYFTSESAGLLLYIKNPSDGVWYKIDFSTWYNTQQLNVTFISNIFFTVNSSTNSINVSDVISLTTLYYYNNEWYTTASTTGLQPNPNIKYYRRVPVSEFEDDSNKTASRPCLYHRGTYEKYYYDSGNTYTETCYFAMDYVYAFIETQYNSSTHKMVDTGYVFYVAYGGYSTSGPAGGPNTGYREYRTNYYVLSTNVSRSSSPLFLTFDSNYNNESCSYILNANNSLKEDTTYPYWTISTPMKLIQYTSLLGGQLTINAIRTNVAPTLLEDDDDESSSYNFMENIDSDYSSNVSELN